MTRLIRYASALVVAFLLLSGGMAAEPEKPKAEPEKSPPAKPATHTVKHQPLKIEVGLKGVFEAESMTEMVLRPDAWSTLKVLEAVEHGTRVQRGDVLVKLDLKAIDEAIADARTGRCLGELALEQAEESLRLLEATTPLDLIAAERAGRIAEEDLARFLEVDRPMSEKSVRFMLEGAQNSLDYAREELRQLEKMYNADDLTEETEEIILTRQRNAVKRAEFSLESAKIRCRQALETGLPREEETIKDATLRQQLAREKAQAALPAALGKAKLEFEKLKVEQARGQEKLEKLLADRAAMAVTAPAGGIVYYGRCVRGKWTSAASVAEKLRRGGSILANEVFMTIVKPRPMVLRATVPEKDLHWIRPGLKGTAQPTALPDVRLGAAVAEVDPIPSSAGSFEARIEVSLNKQAEALVPGMECSVKLVPYFNKEALTVPATALGTDPLDDQKHYVVRVVKAGKQKKQRVVTGKKTDDRVEILKGLSEGDQVLREYPKDKQ